MFLFLVKLYFLITFFFWTYIYFSEELEENNDFLKVSYKFDSIIGIIFDFTIGYIMIAIVLLPIYTLLELIEKIDTWRSKK